MRTAFRGIHLALLAGLSSLLSAQHDDLRLTAVLRSWDKTIDTAHFSLQATDTVSHVVVKGVCDEHGKCFVRLPLYRVYRVELSGTGYVTNSLVLDLNGPTLKQRKWGYRLRIALPLMPRLDQVDYNICERPLSYARFDPKQNEYMWDERYSAELEPYYETLRNRYLEVKAEQRPQP